MKISQELKTIANKLNNRYFDQNKDYNWQKYKSKPNDIRNIYPIENNMLQKYKNDDKFQEAYNKGYLFLDQNQKLYAIHSKQTIGKLQPEKINSDEYLVIGDFNDCYPISKEVFNQRYIHLKNYEYLKKTNIIIQAIKNPFDYQIIVKNPSGELNCKVGDYISKGNNGYAVIDKDIFENTYEKI